MTSNDTRDAEEGAFLSPEAAESVQLGAWLLEKDAHSVLPPCRSRHIHTAARSKFNRLFSLFFFLLIHQNSQSIVNFAAVAHFRQITLL